MGWPRARTRWGSAVGVGSCRRRHVAAARGPGGPRHQRSGGCAEQSSFRRHPHRGSCRGGSWWRCPPAAVDRPRPSFADGPNGVDPPRVADVRPGSLDGVEHRCCDDDRYVDEYSPGAIGDRLVFSHARAGADSYARQGQCERRPERSGAPQAVEALRLLPGMLAVGRSTWANRWGMG